MVDNPTSVFDGEGRYASRTRVNREVVVFTSDDLGSASTASKTVFINGKVCSLIIDPSRVKSSSTTASSGSINFRMDIEDGSNGYLCFDQIGGLDYRTSSNTPLRFEVTTGANHGTATGQNSLHFSVTAPSTATSHNGDTIDEPAAWNGLLCGTTTITVATSAGTFDADTGDLRVVVIYE